MHERVRGAERRHRREVVGKKSGEDHAVVPARARHAALTGDHAVRRALRGLSPHEPCRDLLFAQTGRGRERVPDFNVGRGVLRKRSLQNLALAVLHAPGRLLFVFGGAAFLPAPALRARSDALRLDGIANPREPVRRRGRTASGFQRSSPAFEPPTDLLHRHVGSELVQDGQHRRALFQVPVFLFLELVV